MEQCSHKCTNVSSVSRLQLCPVCACVSCLQGTFSSVLHCIHARGALQSVHGPTEIGVVHWVQPSSQSPYLWEYLNHHKCWDPEFSCSVMSVVVWQQNLVWHIKKNVVLSFGTFILSLSLPYGKVVVLENPPIFLLIFWFTVTCQNAASKLLLRIKQMFVNTLDFFFKFDS